MPGRPLLSVVRRVCATHTACGALSRVLELPVAKHACAQLRGLGGLADNVHEASSNPKTPFSTACACTTAHSSSRNSSLGDTAGGGVGAAAAYLCCRPRSHEGTPPSLVVSKPSYRLPPGSILTKRPVPGCTESLPSCHTTRPLLIVVVTCSHNNVCVMSRQSRGRLAAQFHIVDHDMQMLSRIGALLEETARKTNHIP